MSQGVACTCPESKKPVKDRAWMVTQRNQRCSAFDGYHPRWSDYSCVRCRVCRMAWRTKARFVALLPDAPENWARQP